MPILRAPGFPDLCFTSLPSQKTAHIVPTHPRCGSRCRRSFLTWPMWSPWTPPPAGILWPAGSGPPTPPSRQRPRQGGPAALASWGPRGHSSLTVKGTAGGEGQGPVSVTSFHFSPATRKTQDSVWRSERRLRGPGVLDRGGPGTRPGLSQPHLTASGVGQGLLWPVSPA